MLSFKTVLRKKKLATGKYRIFLRITKNRKSIYFTTPYIGTEAEWNEAEGKFNRRADDYLQRNRLLNKFVDDAIRVVTELEQERGYYTVRDIEEHLRVNKNPLYQNIFLFAKEIIESMIETGNTGNAQVYNDVFVSLRKFNKSKPLSFEEISVRFLEQYEIFLRRNGGADGGVSVKMRTIRALFNKAIRRGIIKSNIYPFKDYQISKLKGKGNKRAVGFDDIQKVVALDLMAYPKLVDAKNYFLFSFYTRGMNFADMMRLKWDDIYSDRIHYTRAKTKGNFSVKILPPVQEILDYYHGIPRNTKYVFPILLHDELTPMQIENRKKKVLQQYNRDLKDIASLCGLPRILSSYVARHSYANCLKQKGVSVEIISESMGHQNLAITQAYLKELDSSHIDDAMMALLVR